MHAATTKKYYSLPLYLGLLALLLISCRGQPFEHQPIHIVMNMDQQRRFEAQEVNRFFADNRAMRQPVDGTVPRGYLKTNTEYYQGMHADSSYVTENPMDVTKSFMHKGKKEYLIYCQPCHGMVGKGNGIIMEGNYNFVPAPSFHSQRLRNMPDGQIFSAITNGVRSMPSYAQQIEVPERWAIVAYIRALQLSQHASKQTVENMNVATDTLLASYRKKQQAQKEKQAAQKKPKVQPTVERGKKLFTQNACNTCHSTDGSKMVGPTLKGLYGKKVKLKSGKTVKADEDYLRESIVKPRAKIVQGYQPVMPNLAASLSDTDVQSLIKYIKTLK